ncbi:coiled-coil domain-containing protein 177 isoform X1 [Leucoraja erinacea]|uniref:coiled-coil domain-containing protein 177 isoform X1 n=1 Tax=Leucoraja erinaceus TaxID=7782 RepID=UPI002454E966|nr:coiled-coil domain-containing protein 177 isoform X1 [Leucoraja erinacea]
MQAEAGADPRGPPLPQIVHLGNLESPRAARGRYVLTSPRSLRACARCGRRPIQLLPRAPADWAREFPREPPRSLQRRCRQHERERRRWLRECREERERIIEEEKTRRTPMPTFVKLDAQKLTSESGFPNSHALHEGERSSRGPLADDKSTSSGWSASRQGNKEPEDRKVSAHLRRRVSKDFVVGHFRKDTNLGDLRQSPATARKLDKLVSEIRRESNVIIPERDRKIAALMLVKHQEEQDRLELRLKAQQFWDKLKRAERLAEMKKETERQKGLINSIGRWKKEQETRHSKIQHDVKQMAELREQDVIWKENKWRMLAENQKLKKKEKLDQAKCEAEIRKSQQKQLQKQSEAVKQDTKEQEVQVSQAKLSNAAQKRLLKEMSNQNRIKTENEHEKLRHTILKNEIDTLTKTEELMVRMSLERKLLTFKENHRQLVEERKRSLKEKVIREENQILQAKLKADKLEQEQKERKEALAEISDLKIEQAQKTLLKRVQSKVLQTQRSRSEKERIHQQIKKKVEEEEEEYRQAMKATIERKDRRSQEILKVKETIIEESRQAARAAFQMRERVREHINSRSFDQMAMEAELWASLVKTITH